MLTPTIIIKSRRIERTTELTAFAVIESVPIGQAEIHFFDDDQENAYLKNIYVKPSARGQRIADILIETIKNEARRRSISRIGRHPIPYEITENGHVIVGDEHATHRLQEWYKSRDWVHDNEDPMISGSCGDWAFFLLS